MSDFEPKTDAEFRAVYGVAPACRDLSRQETTSLLNRELVRCKLERKNAYSYWAHEVEVYDERQGKLVRADFVQFEPGGYHTATHPGNVEAGTFTCYEVKSCLADLKSGHGLNFFGDENYVVMPCEVFPKFKAAWHKMTDDYKYSDRKLHECVPHLSRFEFMLYGRARNGSGAFRVVEDHMRHVPRRKPASELLLCMMRAMIANSGHSDVNHRIVRMDEESHDA